MVVAGDAHVVLGRARRRLLPPHSLGGGEELEGSGEGAEGLGEGPPPPRLPGTAHGVEHVRQLGQRNPAVPVGVCHQQELRRDPLHGVSGLVRRQHAAGVRPRHVGGSSLGHVPHDAPGQVYEQRPRLVRVQSPAMADVVGLEGLEDEVPPGLPAEGLGSLLVPSQQGQDGRGQRGEGRIRGRGGGGEIDGVGAVEGAG